MEFNQFVDEVKGRIKQFLPIEYEDAQVRIEEIKKLNENYLGMTVLKENQVIAKCSSQIWRFLWEAF